jgi:hypothetical protein
MTDAMRIVLAAMMLKAQVAEANRVALLEEARELMMGRGAPISGPQGVQTAPYLRACGRKCVTGGSP